MAQTQQLTRTIQIIKYSVPFLHVIESDIYKKDPNFAVTENLKVSNLIEKQASGGSQ